MYASQVGKSCANRASKAANKKAATAAAEEGSAALSAVFAKGSKALDDLRKVSRSMFWPCMCKGHMLSAVLCVSINSHPLGALALYHHTVSCHSPFQCLFRMEISATGRDANACTAEVDC